MDRLDQFSEKLVIELSHADLLYQTQVAAHEPFSLPLTVAVLQRSGSNLVDTITAGVYRRAFFDGQDAWLVEATGAAEGFSLTVYGTTPEPGAEYWVGVVSRILGAGADLSGFYAAAVAVPGLDALAAEMAGVKPPRYPTAWEALVNGIIFQQVSIESATAIMRRFVRYFSPAIMFDGAEYYPFPTPTMVLPASDAELRSVGCSAAKARALREAAARAEEFDFAQLEQLPNDEVMARLTALRGIGPWTATIVLLRGLGRLDVFPPADSGAARGMLGLFELERDGLQAATERVLALLGPYRGLLYYHLLLWRLKTRGLLPKAVEVT